MTKKIAVIYGSSRPSTAGKAVAEWFTQKVEAPSGVELDLIDLAEVNLPLSEPMPPITGQHEQETTAKWSEQISGYDGFVFVVAEYNLGYTAILKNAIDTLFHEWAEKPAALISYGAFPKSNASEQLRSVLKPFKMKVAEKTLHVTQIRDAVKEDGSLDEEKIVGDDAKDVFGELINL